MKFDDMNVSGCRALVAAVLDQAFSDALSWDKQADRAGARRFINADNKLFIFYCELFDINPEYVRKMQSRIRKHDLRPLDKFRE